MAYLLLKWIHVLSAIIAVGANATYGVWIIRASRDAQALPFTLRTIKVIDDRMANPAYGLLLITGFAMAGIGKLPIRMPWLLTSLILYALLIGLGALGYTPTLKRQIQALDREGAGSPAYRALAIRGRQFGMVLAILAIAIVFLMVMKPKLWG
jgi:uncharacterized membrane protein